MRSVFIWARQRRNQKLIGHAFRYIHILDSNPAPGLVEEALRKIDGSSSASYRYAYLIRLCTRQQALEQGKKVHEQIRRHGFDSETFLGNLLVEMYCKCGSTDDARSVFERISYPNEYTFSIFMSSSEDDDSIHLFHRMLLEGLRADKTVFQSVAAACTSLDELESTHSCILESELEEDVGNAVANSYIRLGGLDKARKLLGRLERKGLFPLTALIGAYAQEGRNEEALRVLHEMDLDGMRPDVVTYINCLRACTNLEDVLTGKSIHSRMQAEGMDRDVIARNSFINMYSRCRCLDEATHIFKQSTGSLTSWNTIIAAYAREDLTEDAVCLFREMLQDGTQPNEVTFVGLLGACRRPYAREVHRLVTESGFETHLVVGTALMTMYGKCGDLTSARNVFDKLVRKNIITWNTMLGAYVQQGCSSGALDIWRRMEVEGIKDNRVTFLNLLDVCESLTEGQALHERIEALGYSGDPVVESAVLNMYMKCRCLERGRAVFERMTYPTPITWTTMIAAYAQAGQGMEALKLFREMDLAGVKADEVTYVNVLASCGVEGNRTPSPDDKLGLEMIQTRIAASGMRSGVLNNNLVGVYGRYGDVSRAEKVFEAMASSRDVCACTTMISTYAHNGLEVKALDVYRRMDHEGVKADEVTYMSVLEACGRLEAVKVGKLVHERVIASGRVSSVYLATALVNMYSKCGDVESARDVFDEMPVKTAVSWNTMLTAYAERGLPEEALELYRTMDVEPDELTYVAVIGACCDMKSLKEGRPVHERVKACGIESGCMISTALVNLYGKCGELQEARRIFENSLHLCWWNVVSWNAMIVGYAQNGEGFSGLEMYRFMRLQGVAPNGVTYTGVLFACAHAGMFEEACVQFGMLTEELKCVEDEHYSCMIDLLGRAGKLEEAEELIRRSRGKVGGVAWLALLNACQMHGDLKRGLRVSEEAIHRNPRTSSSYVMLSNIYSNL